jgi:uncharacterized paraquat-inducible protein A
MIIIVVIASGVGALLLAKRMRVWSSLSVGVLAVVAVAMFASSDTGADAAAAHDYIGADRCAACHASEYATWQQSPHARALSSLTPAQQADPRCRACHTTVPSDPNPALAGVQCESCHGPGKHYSVDYVMRDVELARGLYLEKGDEKTCQRCHTDATPAMTPFHFPTKRNQIKHWSGE